jgi:hypothetical protein
MYIFNLARAVCAEKRLFKSGWKVVKFGHIKHSKFGEIKQVNEKVIASNLIGTDSECDNLIEALKVLGALGDYELAIL